MNKMTKLAALAVAMALPTASNAAIGDYKVVLIHGFQADQLQTKPASSQVETEGADYWKDYWMQYADARIDWPSHERVEGKIASDYVWPKLQELSRNGTCQPGCVLVTHSTGDLVARHLLDNQENWLTNAGLSPLNIVATFDFAGAGGGSELGDIVINITEGGGWTNSAMRYAISLWLGDMPSKNNTGVLNDLKVSNARQIAMLPDHRIPRIRFVGNGSDYLKATASFLPGKDDGVVAAHSSCGASSSGSFDSCSTNLAMDGKMASQSKGVASFMPNHYSFIMGNGYSHSEVIGSKHKGKVTSSNTSIALADGKSVSVDSYQENGWFGNKYIYVQGSQNDTMSEIAVGL
ncbi:hypothetical protein [Vibrio owensii]|uniref:Lipase n=1 Tax=Vibrio owensii CAIM 1854 = LMG 25443 TaxID=1229493 RepID=A0A0C1Z027_9VIBR|nr:hypothetical protein [Vibrio owensii]KIF46141.1 hypothetical protein H735_29025 [Vibrio owensii CAIM 1854 = LMG 25443]